MPFSHALSRRGLPPSTPGGRRISRAPERWVRNPIYIGALLIVAGQAWLFLSVDRLLYAAALAVAFHLIVIGYEELRLRARFSEPYETYQHSVSRWIPAPWASSS